jgi:hypothetical protein
LFFDMVCIETTRIKSTKNLLINSAYNKFVSANKLTTKFGVRKRTPA